MFGNTFPRKTKHTTHMITRNKMNFNQLRVFKTFFESLYIIVNIANFTIYLWVIISSGCSEFASCIDRAILKHLLHLRKHCLNAFVSRIHLFPINNLFQNRRISTINVENPNHAKTLNFNIHRFIRCLLMTVYNSQTWRV